MLEMVLREGKNREIRRILARVGHKVVRLTRIAVGPVRLGNLPAGAFAPPHARGGRRAPPRGSVRRARRAYLFPCLRGREDVGQPPNHWSHAAAQR